jgi:hypothetical protein
MNDQSSRSHAVCTINIAVTQPSTSEEQPRSPPSRKSATMCFSKIHLVDLAGSERLRQALKKGESTLETRQINKGLHALSNVISALSSPATPRPGPAHVPYRDSKLTRLLQDSLGGSAKTLIIACVSPVDESVHESLTTLQYAARARHIDNCIVKNERLGQQQPVISLKEEILLLQWQLLKRHLAHAGLLPIPELLLQVGHSCSGRVLSAVQETNSRLHFVRALL